MKLILLIFLWLLPLVSYAEEKILNIYGWSGEIPDQVIQQFEKESGIKVNFSTYENNEVMFAKLRALKKANYDLIIPSGYFVDRMRKLNMLQTLDKTKIPNWKNLNPNFTNAAYDPGSIFSVPFIWGVTGIFVNQQYYSPVSIKKWADLWQERFNNQLMLLEDMRDAFSIALLTMGYSINDRDPQHLQAAFLKLKTLMKNIKVFSTDTVVSIMIDEDATVGIAWNGDVYKASQENPNLKFIFPAEGFMIWIDTFAIPRNAEHQDAAYAFINFLLRPEISQYMALQTNYATANLAAQKLLPENIRNNPEVYPPAKILTRGQFQTDLGDETLALMEKYWEQLKMGG